MRNFLRYNTKELIALFSLVVLFSLFLVSSSAAMYNCCWLSEDIIEPPQQWCCNYYDPNYGWSIPPTNCTCDEFYFANLCCWPSFPVLCAGGCYPAGTSCTGCNGSLCVGYQQSCTSLSCCSPYSCRTDYDGSGKFCCSSSECGHNNTCYANGIVSGDYQCSSGTWVLYAPVPSVTTEIATVNAQNNQANLRGNITDTGGDDVDKIMFIWGTSPGSYPNNSGEITYTGTFEYTLTAMIPGTIYYYKAQAHSSVGWSDLDATNERRVVIYTASGGQQQFTTLMPLEISNLQDEPDPVNVGEQITFSADVSATYLTRMLVCKDETCTDCGPSYETETIDQSHTFNGLSPFHAAGPDWVHCHKISFTKSGLTNKIEFAVGDGDPNTGAQIDTITVKMREGGCKGPILAQDTVSVADWQHGTYYTFTWDSPVAVTAGTDYYFTSSYTGGSCKICGHRGDPWNGRVCTLSKNNGASFDYQCSGFGAFKTYISEKVFLDSNCWCNTTFNTETSKSCSYTTTDSDSGFNNYWAKACSENDDCSEIIQGDGFTVDVVDNLPQITISCPECTLIMNLGDVISVTVSATDDYGLNQLLLRVTGEQPNHQDLFHDCGGITPCSHTWDITLDYAGTDPDSWDWNFWGIAEDTAGQWGPWVLTVVPDVFDFDLLVSPNSGSIEQGQSVSTTVTANLLSSATREVSFSTSGLPSGTSTSFSPTSCSPTCDSTMTVTTSATTPTGTSTITIKGENGNLVRTATYNLTITGACLLSGSDCFSPEGSISCGGTLSGCLNASDWKYYSVPDSAGKEVTVTLTFSGTGCNVNDLYIYNSGCSSLYISGGNLWTETWTGTPTTDIKIGVDGDSSNPNCQWDLSVDCVLPSYPLTVSKAGTGSGTVTSSPSGINCGTDCSESYSSGTSVTLTATSDSGSEFFSWSGCLTMSGNICEVTMNESKTVTATFNLSADTTPPVTIISPNGKDWGNSDVNFTLSCDDGAGSGCQTTQYKIIDQSQSCDISGLINGTSSTVTCPAGQTCQKKVCFRSIDNENNEEPIKTSNLFKIDKTKPTSTITSPPAGSTQNTDFLVSISDTDTGGSGLNVCFYRTYDSGIGWTRSWTTRTCNSSQTITVSSTGDCRTIGGTCTVYVYSYDSAGNQGDINNRSFNIGEAPSCTYLSADPTEGPAPLTVSFIGSGSDPDGTIVAYQWDFGDAAQDTITTITDYFDTNNPNNDPEYYIASKENLVVSGGEVRLKEKLEENGEPCSSPDECLSGYCIDGVCCNTACDDQLCQRCDNYSNAGTGTCGYVSSSSQDPDDECTQGSSSLDGCRSNYCSSTGYSCGVQTSGDGGCPSCHRCTDSDIACEYYPDNAQDPTGCSGTCEACFSGSCNDANHGTDPGNHCSTLECGTGFCKGGGVCDYYTSGEHNCSICKTCDGATSTSCKNIPEGEKDTQGVETCTALHYRCDGFGICSAPTHYETSSCHDNVDILTQELCDSWCTGSLVWGSGSSDCCACFYSLYQYPCSDCGEGHYLCGGSVFLPLRVQSDFGCYSICYVYDYD